MERRQRQARGALRSGLLMGWLLIWPGMAKAQLHPAEIDAKRKSGAYLHDRLFLRLTAGPGVRFLFADGPEQLGGSHQLISADTLVGLHGGWALTDVVVLHAQLLLGAGWALRGLDGAGGDLSLGYVAAGVGATAYGATDVFLTATIGYAHAGWIGADSGPAPLDGIMAGLQFGKEWWVRPTWLLGVGGQIDYQWLRGGGDTWHGLGLGALLSITWD